MFSANKDKLCPKVATECEVAMNKILDRVADLRTRLLTYESQSGAISNMIEEIFVKTWIDQTRLFANLRQLLDDSNDKIEFVRSKLRQASLNHLRIKICV